MPKKLTVAIYFDQPGKMDYPFDHLNYYEAYKAFSKQCKRRQVDLYFVRGNSYLQSMCFAAGWHFVNDELTDVNEPIKVDLIYGKGVGKGLEEQLKPAPSDVFFNRPELDLVALDKLVTYQHFGHYMARSWAIDAANWQTVIPQIKTKLVVLKPTTGATGRGIIICPVAGFRFTDHPINEPYLAQEFIDSSTGIPGLVEGTHDLRLLLFNGEVKLSYIRMPKAGSLLANLNQGGSLKIVELADIPPSALKIAKEVDAQFQNCFPRVYTIDYMYEGEKPYLVELNTRPGLPYLPTHGPVYTDQFYNALIDTFLSASPAH